MASLSLLSVPFSVRVGCAAVGTYVCYLHKSSRLQANGYLDTERGKLICQLLYSMNYRSRHLFKGRSDGVAFACLTRKCEYKFESVWTKDTLLIYLRDGV